MQQWEYCSVDVTLYREGSSGGTRELLHITLPGAHPASASNAFGLIGLLNQLGSEGWELVDVDGRTFYLKRPAKA